GAGGRNDSVDAVLGEHSPPRFSRGDELGRLAKSELVADTREIPIHHVEGREEKEETGERRHQGGLPGEKRRAIFPAGAKWEPSLAPDEAAKDQDPRNQKESEMRRTRRVAVEPEETVFREDRPQSHDRQRRRGTRGKRTERIGDGDDGSR